MVALVGIDSRLAGKTNGLVEWMAWMAWMAFLVYKYGLGIVGYRIENFDLIWSTLL